MLNKLVRIPYKAWLVLLSVLASSVLVVIISQTKALDGSFITYSLQPILAALVALLAHKLANGKRLTVRHQQDKAIVIASVIAIWFVLYFASGVFLTFVHNALVSGLPSILLNILGFGVTAAAIEYARYCALGIAGRRNAVLFGVIATIIFALAQIGLTKLPELQNAADVVKFIISGALPALASSALLTYLAFSAGLASMLSFRLGVIAISILPPIIPKYDWYMVGVSSIILPIIIFIVIDRLVATGRSPRTKRHLNIALESTWLIAIVALVLFMSGVFTYKPTAIMSDSMQPVFGKGSMVIVQKNINKMDIKVGDIIQYEAHGMSITHRVELITQSNDGKGSRILITKGDNNPSRDEPIPIDSIKGIVRAAIPNVGYPTVWLRELTLGNRSNEVNK